MKPKHDPIPIKQEIEVLGPDDAKQLKLGWIIEERIGIGIVSPKLTWRYRWWIKIKSWFIKSEPEEYNSDK